MKFPVVLALTVVRALQPCATSPATKPLRSVAKPVATAAGAAFLAASVLCTPVLPAQAQADMVTEAGLVKALRDPAVVGAIVKAVKEAGSPQTGPKLTSKQQKLSEARRKREKEDQETPATKADLIPINEKNDRITMISSESVVTPIIIELIKNNKRDEEIKRLKVKLPFWLKE